MIFLNVEEDLTWKKEWQVLYFNATWMPLNKKNLFMLEKLAKKHPNILPFVIDMDCFKGLCRRFDIVKIPSFIITRNGKVVGRIEESLRTKKFISFFDDIYIK